MSHQGPRQRHQAAADPPYVHEETSQNEEGHGEHGERIHPRYDLLRNDDEREIRQQDGDDGGDRERKPDGDGGQHQEAEDPEEEPAHQPLSSAGRSPTPAASRLSESATIGLASIWIAMNTPDTGAAA